MKKQEALNKIKDLECEISKLKEIINKSEDLFDIINDYSDVCNQLNEPEFYHNNKKIEAFVRIDQIQRLFNSNWRVDFSDKNQQKWFPCFEYKSGYGLVFDISLYDSYDLFYGPVAYYRTNKISDFIGKKFIHLYKDIIS